MNKELAYQLSADLLLITHVLFIAFVVLGFLLIVAGIVFRWSRIKNFWFRSLHLVAIGIVAAQAWLGELCPLTRWESSLRVAAGSSAYPASFVEYWLHKFIFYNFAPWIFTTAYTIFAVLIIITWILAPPEPPRKKYRQKLQ